MNSTWEVADVRKPLISASRAQGHTDGCRFRVERGVEEDRGRQSPLSSSGRPRS